MQLQFSAKKDLNPGKIELINCQSDNSHQFNHFGIQNTILYPIQHSYSQQKISYTRVSQQQLHKQAAIYEWRRRQNLYIIPILSFCKVSSGNPSNSDPLLKISLPQYNTSFSDLGKLCIGQCLSLAKQLIASAKILFGQFGFRKITQKMIVLDDLGYLRVWICQNHHLNPDNTLGEEKNDPIPQNQALAAIIYLLKKKCLENKLSKDLFLLLEKQENLQTIEEAIVQYEKQKKILVPQQILSNNSKINNSNFGMNSVKIKINPVDYDQENQKNTFLGSTRLSKNLLSSSRKIILGSQKQVKIQPNNTKNSYTTKANSQLLQPNPQTHPILDKMMKISGISECNSNFPIEESPSTPELLSPLSPKKLSLKSCVFAEQIKTVGEEFINPGQEKESRISEKQVNISQEILMKNGWEQSLTCLPLEENMDLKQSINCGKQERNDLKEIKLMKLHTMGRDLSQSFFPVEEQLSEQF